MAGGFFCLGFGCSLGFSKLFFVVGVLLWFVFLLVFFCLVVVFLLVWVLVGWLGKVFCLFCCCVLVFVYFCSVGGFVGFCWLVLFSFSGYF